MGSYSAFNQSIAKQEEKLCLEEDNISFLLLQQPFQLNFQTQMDALELRLTNRKSLLIPKYQLLLNNNCL